MAFQDFDKIQEQRENERRQRLRKRITIGIISAIVLVGLVGAAVCVYIKYEGTSKSTQTETKTKPVATADKAVKSICAPTEFKETCESSLLKAVREKTSTSEPKDLIKASFVVASNAVGAAVDHLKTLVFDTPEKKAAFDDCMTLLGDAKQELNATISLIEKNDLKALSGSISDDINNYLSAVLSYQDTCIDGIPDGPSKADVEKALVLPKQLSSISLAIVSSLSSILKIVGGLPSPKRSLLTTRQQSPLWIKHEDRRMLKEQHVPNVTVAKDGSGNFSTINEALAAMPPKHEGRYVIYIKEGIYEENVVITKSMVNVTIFGDGSQKSIITGNKNKANGVPTYQTATFAAIGDGFMAQSVGFRNTAGSDKLQAVALRVTSDRSIFLSCRVEGFQGALYAQTHRQLYRGTYITGSVDIIFGDAAAVFQNCLIYVRKPAANQQNTVTAQGRVDKNENTGFVIQNCRILAEDKLESEKATIKSYLGRPWKKYSKTIVMETEIADFINPEGWLAWNGDFALKTLNYVEYNNRGPGAATTGRVKWVGLKTDIKREQALKYTVGRFLQGELWLKGRDVPVRYTLST